MHSEPHYGQKYPGGVARSFILVPLKVFGDEDCVFNVRVISCHLAQEESLSTLDICVGSQFVLKLSSAIVISSLRMVYP